MSICCFDSLVLGNNALPFLRNLNTSMFRSFVPQDFYSNHSLAPNILPIPHKIKLRSTRHKDKLVKGFIVGDCAWGFGEFFHFTTTLPPIKLLKASVIIPVPGKISSMVSPSFTFRADKIQVQNRIGLAPTNPFFSAMDSIT